MDLDVRRVEIENMIGDMLARLTDLVETMGDIKVGINRMVELLEEEGTDDNR